MRPPLAAGPGLFLAAVLALLASAIAAGERAVIGQTLIEPLVLALLLGVVARNLLRSPARFGPGTGFAAKQLLEVGVALLGVAVDLRLMFAAGPALAALVLAGVAGGLAVSYGSGRLLGLTSTLAVLVAVGNSICGNSAIAAVAPVIRADKKDVASAIGLTAVLGVCLVLLLPLSLTLFALSHYQYGVLAGMSVYAVPQVVAAAFPVSQLAGEVATLVKLMRVMLLGPVVLFFALLYRGGGVAERSWKTYLPPFVLVFLALAALRSLGIITDAFAVPAQDTSRALTTVAMAGLGFGVDLGAVRKVGPRVGAAVIISLSFMIGLALTLIRVLAIGG